MATLGRAQRGRPEAAAPRNARLVEPPGRARTCATAAGPRPQPSPATPRASASTQSSAEDVTLAAPCASKSTRDGGGRGRPPARRASRARRARRRAASPLARLGGTGRTAPRRARARRPPSPVVSEVEQAAGDDVALDLGAAAVDGGRPRVEELGPPAPAGRVVAQRHLRAQRPRPPGRRRPARPSPRAPCRWRSPAPSVSPAASRRWVARERARNAQSSSIDFAHAPSGRAHPGGAAATSCSAAAAGRRRGATARCSARRAAGPWRWPSRRRPGPACGRAGR